MPSKDLIAFLHTQGHRPASHMSNLEDTVASILRDRLRPKIQKEKAARDKAAGIERVPATRGKGEPGVAGADLTRRPGTPPRPGRAPGTPSRPGAGTGEAARRPGAAAEGGRAEGTRPWGEGTEGAKDSKAKEKDREKDKEVPRVKRYFPTQEDLYDSGPRFGGVRRKVFGKPRRPKDGKDDGGVAVQERPQKIEITPPVSLREFSSLTGIKAQTIITSLWQQGHRVNINQFLDEDMVTMIAVDHGVDVVFKKTREEDIEETLQQLEDFKSSPDDLVPRAPVVTFLGHVDHGKTSLLDKIRETNVTAKEAGGITQHLGAYRVDQGNVHVVFIDTPGHQAFTEMRARGAHVTDVAVLVVAADDGVMPQTEEALSHARAAKVPIVVAVNKIDKPSANAMRCKQQLSSLGLQPVEWGGDTEFVEVSALTSQGINTLLETLSLTSEILDLKASPKRAAVGVCLEAKSSPSVGVLVTLLVRDGTLRVGDCLLCGPAYGRVRGMWRNGVERVREAGPSTPVTVTGLNRVPQAGDKFYVFSDLERPKEITEKRLMKRAPDRAAPATLAWPKDEIPEVGIVLKADVQGSLEALKSSLGQLSTDEVKLKILHAQVGGVNHADIVLADAFGAIVIAFNVGPDEQARMLAEEKDVEIRRYDVIYKLIDDVRAALSGELKPQLEEEIHGHAEVRQLFKASKVGTIAGCMVVDGTILRSDQVRVIRAGKVLHTGGIASLRRFKDDAKEVKAGFDCGLKVVNFEDLQEGDSVEAFAIVEKPRQL